MTNNVSPHTLRIAVDFDGFLLPTYEQKTKWYRENYDPFLPPFNPEDWTDHSMVTLWGGEQDTLGPLYDTTRDTYTALPIPGSLAAMRALQRDASRPELFLLSSGYDWQRVLKDKWVNDHEFPIQRSVYMEQGQTKADVCRLEGATCILEDRYDYALNCATSGTPAILLQRYTWSRGPEHELIYKIDDHNGVLDAYHAILGLKLSHT